MLNILQTETHVAPPTDHEGELLRAAGGNLIVLSGASAAQLRSYLASADAILCATVAITKDVLQEAKRLRIVARLGTGVDNIDLEAATEEGIVVTNVPDFATADVAEHVMALIMACAKRLLPLDAATKSGDWDIRLRTRLHTLQGSVLGLIGFGRIGRAVAQYAIRFEMPVLAHDPFVPAEEIATYAGARPVNLDTALREADFVSLHVPLTHGTKHLISHQELARMKASAYLINCGRGALVDEAALVEAITAGRLAGAALDVFEQEPPDPACTVLQCPNIMVTPHCAAHTERALDRLRASAMNSVLQALRGEWPDHVVNPEVRKRWMKRMAALRGL